MGSFSMGNMNTTGSRFQIATTTHERKAYGIKMVVVVAMTMKKKKKSQLMIWLLSKESVIIAWTCPGSSGGASVQQLWQCLSSVINAHETEKRETERWAWQCRPVIGKCWW